MAAAAVAEEIITAIFYSGCLQVLKRQLSMLLLFLILMRALPRCRPTQQTVHELLFAHIPSAL
jgi:hypothetical protein